MQKLLFIPNGQKRWIAGNILLNHPADELARILVDNGFPADVARLEIKAASAHPYLQAAQSTARRLLKRD